MFMINIYNPFAGKLEGPDWKKQQRLDVYRETDASRQSCAPPETPGSISLISYYVV